MSDKREIINKGDYTIASIGFLLTLLLVIITAPFVFNWLVDITTPLTWLFPVATIALTIFGWFRNRSFVGILGWGLLSVLLLLAIFQASILNNIFYDTRLIPGV